ncbi:tRNA 5-methoxyuridine(34)/uridine 5-oxyacetic acid(34) synthase CmoB [Candidatus Marinamargulisbacteria bacterium SCGC AG-439-L15]|nr:tRNA 5-methoxyuridine(34)/uridine 5-oxyacetic acid(34) synthase CmoB [Candidatus Marinamargulisbacteria bacterium SCGC AG-439-L15]
MNRDGSKKQLETLRFWRKGPFNIFGIHIDAEWQANLKWDRLKGHEDALFENKLVLDVGASSGYYMMRMLAHNPEFILGIDPTFLYFKQFSYLQNFLKKEQQSLMDYLVLGVEDMADFNTSFDTVVCMGILYHRPCSFTAIKRLKDLLKEGGILLLESIIIDAEKGLSLGKKNRYAGMRNVYEIPTEKELLSWVKEAGFKNIEILDVSKTSISEQRSTPWTTEVSLKDFLHPSDHSKTIEGHPAPKRIMLIATNKK